MKGKTSLLLCSLLVVATVAGCGADGGSDQAASAPATVAPGNPSSAAGSRGPGLPAPSGNSSGAGRTAPACVAGSWRSTGVNGQFGSAAGRISGGTGTVMTVGTDGMTDVGFTDSQPLAFSADAAGATVRGQVRYTGSLHAAVVFEPRGTGAGVWQPRNDANHSDLRVTVKLSQPVSVTLLDNAGVGRLAAADVPGAGEALDIVPVLRGGTYTCDRNTLRVRTEQNGPRLTWAFTRAS